MTDAVERYLAGLASRDWEMLAASLAPDVVRVGPYRDTVRGRDSYASFLRTTIESLTRYELHVERIVDGGTTVLVELDETVDDAEGRLRTDEAVVFDLDDGLISHVRVYLQTSHHV